MTPDESCVHNWSLHAPTLFWPKQDIHPTFNEEEKYIHKWSSEAPIASTELEVWGRGVCERMSLQSIFHTSHLTPLFGPCDLSARLCSFPSKIEELDRISKCLPSCPGQNQRIVTDAIKNKILMVKVLIKDESSWVPTRVHCSNKKKSNGIISWPSVFILLKYYTDFPKKSMHKVVREERSAQ